MQIPKICLFTNRVGTMYCTCYIFKLFYQFPTENATSFSLRIINTNLINNSNHTNFALVLYDGCQFLWVFHYAIIDKAENTLDASHSRTIIHFLRFWNIDKFKLRSESLVDSNSTCKIKHCRIMRHNIYEAYQSSLYILEVLCTPSLTL